MLVCRKRLCYRLEKRTYIEQELQQRIGLFILETDNPLREAWIDEKRLLASNLNDSINFESTNAQSPTYGMHSHNRMLIQHRLASNELAVLPGVLSLRITIMYCGQAFQKLLDRI